MPATRLQRVEENLGVQYLEADETNHGIIRGWLGAPDLYDLSLTTLTDGIWVIKREADGAVYLASDADVRRDFIIVVPG